MDETATPGSDYLAKLAYDWEEEAIKAEAKGVRVLRIRIGIVLGRDGGALHQMTLPFRFLSEDRLEMASNGFMGSYRRYMQGHSFFDGKFTN